MHNLKPSLRQSGLIHRMAMSGRGRAQCGAVAPEHGYLNLSMHGVGVTCPDCIGPKMTDEEIRAAQWASIEEAAARGRAKRAPETAS